MAIKNENHVVIQGWMVNELHLKGNELIVFAVIYGFSQSVQRYSGGLQYLADWTNSTKRGVIKNIQSLLDKGLIQKNENLINGVKFCEYESSPLVNKVHGGGEQSSLGGSEQSSPNNIDINNISNINNKEKYKKESFKKIIQEYTTNEELIEALNGFIEMRKAMNKSFTDRALNLSLTELDKLGGDDNTKIEIVNQTLLHGWKSFYPLKNDNKPKHDDSIDNPLKSERRAF